MDEQRNIKAADRNSPFLLGMVLGLLLGLYAGEFVCARYGSADEEAEEAAALYREKVQRDLGSAGAQDREADEALQEEKEKLDRARAMLQELQDQRNDGKQVP